MKPFLVLILAALTFSANQPVKVNAQGAAVGHAWIATTTLLFGSQTPIKIGDTAFVKTGRVVFGNNNPYVWVHFTSGASSGKDAYVGTDWIDAVGTPPVVTPPVVTPPVTPPPVTPPPTTICPTSGTIQITCNWDTSTGTLVLSNCK
jgi:hypothetical protein